MSRLEVLALLSMREFVHIWRLDLIASLHFGLSRVSPLHYCSYIESEFLLDRWMRIRRYSLVYCRVSAEGLVAEIVDR